MKKKEGGREMSLESESEKKRTDSPSALISTLFNSEHVKSVQLLNIHRICQSNELNFVANRTLFSRFFP